MRLSVEEIVLDKSCVKVALDNIANNKLSRSSRLPADVCFVPHLNKFYVRNGYHRILQQYFKGEIDFKCDITTQDPIATKEHLSTLEILELKNIDQYKDQQS